MIRSNSREARNHSAFIRPLHALALVHLGEAAQAVEEPDELVGGVELDVVDAALEPVQRPERLADQQLSGGEVHPVCWPKPGPGHGGT